MSAVYRIPVSLSRFERVYLVTCFLVFSFVCTLGLGAQADASGVAPATSPSKLSQLAQVEKGLAAPESVLWDTQRKRAYVTNVAGSPTSKDGRGWITVLDEKATVLNEQWVAGLDAPKGMALSADGHYLYVADLRSLKRIDVERGLVDAEYTVAGANFLNDVAISPDGRIFVSDTFASAVWVLEPGASALASFASGLAQPNGLWIEGEQVLVAHYSARFDRTRQVLPNMSSISLNGSDRSPLPFAVGLTIQADGIFKDALGRWYLSDNGRGEVFVLEKTAADQAYYSLRSLGRTGSGTADIFGFVDSQGRTVLLVPAMGSNRVSYYRVE